MSDPLLRINTLTFILTYFTLFVGATHYHVFVGATHYQIPIKKAYP